jgi:hypothetical protein
MEYSRIRGASFIKTVIVLLILFTGGLLLFQYASSFFIKNNIYSEIYDRIGLIIGDSANALEVKQSGKALMKVLEEYKDMGRVRLSRDDIKSCYVKLDRDTGKVSFYFQYTLVMDLIVTETTEHVKRHGILQ